MQCLTQLDVQGGDFLLEMDSFIAEANLVSDSKTLAAELARLAWKNHETCDQFIADTVKHWQLQRIALIDRAILRLAITEMLYRTDVPVKVVLDQAIELAKKYSTAESPQFINGVLDAIARKMHGSTDETESEMNEPAPPEETEVPLEPSDIVQRSSNGPEEENE